MLRTKAAVQLDTAHLLWLLRVLHDPPGARAAEIATAAPIGALAAPARTPEAACLAAGLTASFGSPRGVQFAYFED